MNRLIIVMLSIAMTACSTFNTPVKKISAESNSCVYIANLGEVLATYAVLTRKAEYGGNIGYQGSSIGGTLRKDNEFIALQDRLGQQAATINNVVKSIVIMHNKSCEQYNTDRAWDSMDRLINGLQKVYGKVFIKYGAKE